MPPRKLRKGTHSCWECRRRKVRCQFSSPSAAICTPCSIRGSPCRSQDLVDSPPPQRERTHAQRLDRLEELMQRLVERILPDGDVAERRPGEGWFDAASSIFSTSGTRDAFRVAQNVDTPGIDETPVGLLLGPGSDTSSALTPELGGSYSSLGSGIAGINRVSQRLHALFPSQEDMKLITESSPGTIFLAALFSSDSDGISAIYNSTEDIATIPQISSQPTMLAKRLLQLAICMQQLSPSFDTRRLGLKVPVATIMVHIDSTISNLVISNDDYMANVDGLQCIILHGFWHMNAGNLRKAWLTFRRASSLAQLIGIGPGSNDSNARKTKENLTPFHNKIWYLLAAFDRHLSLFLGLRIDMRDVSFASEEWTKYDSPEEKLEKLHTVIAARIADRNHTTNEGYAIMQAIDYDLDMGAKRMGQMWWSHSSPVCETPEQNWQHRRRLMIQINHFGLLVMLHLLYLLRDPTEHRYTHSRMTCIRSGREILTRFISLREDVESIFSCRHIDYAASIAAITLLLSYLVQGAIPVSDSQRENDRIVIGQVKDRMEQVVLLNDDKFLQESSHIISQLLPVLDTDSTNKMTLSAEDNLGETVQLNIPYLGLVSICLKPKQRAKPTSSVERSDQQSRSASLSHEQHANDWNIHEFIHVEEAFDGHLPTLTAEASDWPFQGIDTNFWSLLQGGIVDSDGFNPPH
ncbi:hypothetical protein BO94DRAFT_64289 [Aspergillus sclerotioniger CBS 115572]|uniref:Zn(2)-C6 fungal-type domain-containing protein n=1 Tax=Aspergillus sclerotioniger CBS 115572 TaxID=1450535 RepID=A0A317WT37_9EURO|nr:hypothetical protein BO94DRAFT_64289 [Aspergillus sclerotioniger CBS 115572]PWY88088.1 hypothetical protein BO94DRAFT_64289 [Aspergillus sclerotioniger CBS 115572]